VKARIRPNATDQARQAAADKLHAKKPHLKPSKKADGSRIGMWTAGIVNYAETRAGRRLAAAINRRGK